MRARHAEVSFALLLVGACATAGCGKSEHALEYERYGSHLTLQIERVRADVARFFAIEEGAGGTPEMAEFCLTAGQSLGRLGVPTIDADHPLRGSVDGVAIAARNLERQALVCLEHEAEVRRGEAPWVRRCADACRGMLPVLLEAVDEVRAALRREGIEIRSLRP